MAEIYTLPKTQEELTTLEKERMAVYNELLESRKAQRPLTGRVIQCKPNDKASDSKMRVMAVVNYKGWKILIPIGLMGLDLSSDRKSTRLNSSHSGESRMPSSA